MKKILHLIFGRFFVVAMAIILQVLWLCVVLWQLSYKFTYVNLLVRVIAIIVVLVIVNKWTNPANKLSWTFLILLSPIFGLMVYFLFGRSGLTKHTRERMDAVNRQVEALFQRDSAVEKGLEKESRSAYLQSSYIDKWAGFPLYQNTQTKYYSCGEEMFPDMLEALCGAKHFIFLEYFIIEEGYMFNTILDILEEKAKAGVRIEGEAVWSLTAMFLEMWNYINRSTEDYSRFLPSVYREKEFTSDGFVQPYGDSPLDNENVGENIYLNIINRAKNYVYIFTPYLIIDHEMLICLSNAAKSGVDVRIVTPGVPDKKAVYLLTQSYYEPLLKNGVKIFQYTPGFIHAKCFVCDDEIATVGSVNLDYRSLFLHFECGVFMYRSKAVMQVKEDCLRTFEESEEMDVSFCRRRRLPVRMVQSLMRLFAPLL